MSDTNPHSTAKIAGHPLHPMIIPFPIVFFVTTLATDITYLQTGRPGFAEASVWLLGAGLAMAALAAVLGLIDFLGDQRVRSLRHAWWHMIGNVIAVGLEAWNIGLRIAGGATNVAGAAVLLSAITVALLAFNGWMGWELVYRHHVGVSDVAET